MKRILNLKHLKLVIKEKLRILILIPQMYQDRKAILKQLKKSSLEKNTSPNKSLLILSPHSSDPFASKGDEALALGVIEKIRKINPNKEISIITDVETDQNLQDRLLQMDIKQVNSWEYPWRLSKQIEYMAKYDELLCIGADVMDGYYSAIKSLRMWMCVDLMARMNKNVVVGGFSFNQTPSKLIVEFLKTEISSQVKICLRDPVSRRRFEEACKVKSQLVADQAFLLEANSNNDFAEEVVTWIKTKQNTEKVVLGFNLHPLLIKNMDKKQIQTMIQSSAETLKTLISENNASIVLLPHDFRDSQTGDLWFLNELHKNLSMVADEIYFVNKSMEAANLKYIAGNLDLVITGRMHLSIGSLSMGTPILGITYQGKFEGLIEHFSLPNSVLISPEEIFDTEVFIKFVRHGLGNISHLKNTIEKELPNVKQLSFENISNLT